MPLATGRPFQWSFLFLSFSFQFFILHGPKTRFVKNKAFPSLRTGASTPPPRTTAAPTREETRKRKTEEEKKTTRFHRLLVCCWFHSRLLSWHAARCAFPACCCRALAAHVPVTEKSGEKRRRERGEVLSRARSKKTVAGPPFFPSSPPGAFWPDALFLRSGVRKRHFQ